MAAMQPPPPPPHTLTTLLPPQTPSTSITQLHSNVGRQTNNPSSTPGGSRAAEIDTIDQALIATACDHNWADVEQFLMEENYKATSSTDIHPMGGNSVSPSGYNMPIVAPSPAAYWTSSNVAQTQSGTSRGVKNRNFKLKTANTGEQPAPKR